MQNTEGVIRVRIPKRDEILGIITAALGSGKMEVKCSDGNVRICRIPGKMRKRIMMRVGDLVIIEPWVVQSHERADIAWMYRRNEVEWLREKGFLKNIDL